VKRTSSLATLGTALLLSVATGVRSEQLDVLAAARSLASNSRVGASALAAAQGGLWRQVRQAERGRRDDRFSRYRCGTALQLHVFTEAFAQVYATHLDAATLLELSKFYERRDIQFVMDSRTRELRRAYGLPELASLVTAPYPPPVQIDLAKATLANMRESSSHRAFDNATRVAQAGPALAVFKDNQEGCAVPASQPAALPIPADAPLQAGAVDARILRSTPPRYPVLAKRLGVEGMIEARVRIGADGRPTQAVIVRRWFNLPVTPDEHASRAMELIERSVTDSLMSTIFEPAKRDGEPVETIYNAPFNFVLE